MPDVESPLQTADPAPNRRRVRLDRALRMDELLAAVPVVNRAVRVEDHGQVVRLYVPIRKRWWMRGPVSWALPMRDEKAMQLDKLGAEVWRACDGVRDVEAVVERFAAAHKLRFAEARVSVMEFLKMLMQRNLVVLVGKGGDD